jgi:hypothetical protein
MIFSINENVFLRDMTNVTLQIIYDAWWSSMNMDSKLSITWKHSRYAHLWRFYFHCRIEKTGSPGIICIVWHQDLHNPLEHGTSSMGKHLQAKVHITKVNELTESEVSELTKSMVDALVLAILKRQGIQGITILRSELTLLFHI